MFPGGCSRKQSGTEYSGWKFITGNMSTVKPGRCSYRNKHIKKQNLSVVINN
jgi:hypothetical protein